MRNLKLKATAAGVGCAALGLVAAGALYSSADAVPAGTWELGYGNNDYAQTNDVISAIDLDLAFTGTYNGPATVSCNNVAVTDFEYVVPATVPSGPANGTMMIDLDTPTTSIDDCINSVDGKPISVSFASGSKWRLTINLPDDTGYSSGDAYSGTLTGSITVPNDASGFGGTGGRGTITATATTLAPYPCILTGPAYADAVVAGSYNTGTGVAVNTNNPMFFLDNGYWPSSYPPLSGTTTADCQNAGNQATLQSASVTLENQDGKKPTAVLQ